MRDPLFHLRVPAEVKAWVKEKASKDERSMNYVIVRELRRAMCREELERKVA